MVIEYSEEPVHKKHKYKIIIFGIFLIILSILIYTSFSGNMPFTGGVIKGEINLNNSISVSADLTIPSLSLNGNFKKVNIRGSSDSFFYVGDKKFPLSNSKNNHIVLTDYDGEINFNWNVISKLKGKAMKVSVNGVPMVSKSDNKMKIYFDADFNFDILEVEGAFIKKLNYETSGTIKLDDQKTILNLDNDDLTLKNFQGNLELRNNRFIINGYLNSLEVKGTKDISISV